MKNDVPAEQGMTAPNQNPQERINELEASLATTRQRLMMNAAFLSDASHEIRTPMNAIIGTVSLALMEEQPAHTREQFEKIGASARQMLSLINDILDVSRISSGHISIRRDPFPLHTMLEQVAGAIRLQCGEKGITFVQEGFDDLTVTCLGDGLRLKQALMGVLLNAVHFTPPGGEVHFRVDTSAQNEGTFVFTVKDTGIGMEETFLPHVFDAFAREDATTEGAGLGLTITKNIVDLMNGTIEVSSVKDKGSTFTLRIPLETVEAANGVTERDAGDPQSRKSILPQASSGKQTDTSVGNALAGKRILVAEDVKINAQILLLLLKKNGMRTEHAANGKIALDLYTEHESGYYDAILMDVRMPVMDGLEATRAIRASGRTDAATIPVIAMTAGVFEEDQEKTRDAGLNAHLPKPVDSELLLQTLKELVL